ncbi:unnamed protein product, partial [Didymodactylos carnosus]
MITRVYGTFQGVIYHYILLHLNDHPKTAFNTRDNRYQFAVLSQDFTNGPPPFQRIVNQALGVARWKKSEIANTEVGFLGHQVKTGHIKPNPENIRALMETQIPTTEEEACRFLKGAEYYRKFIRGFSSIADLLFKYVLKKKQGRSKQTSITLAEKELTAFHELKHILTSDLVLGLPSNQLQRKIQTDASKVDTGAVLLQVDRE